MLLTMPCWYYNKKDLKNTPTSKDGIDATTEARYRKEGARFIIDCGTKLGLRYDSCATGVVFFHRFYMFHSFKDYPRYVTAACCLFLAGKTEETPKKCKDIMKTTKSMLTDAQYVIFGDDPKEEVMTMERILLQTIKFDLMVEHPYAYLLKFAKLMKGKGSQADKSKIQKLVQMAWTFINDSLCTTLCLQWEPEVVAISLMYLATRLNKTDLSEWTTRQGIKGKWWEALVEDVNQELLEDICHQVLDLYQPTKSPGAKPSPREDTPPPPPPPRTLTAVASTSKRSRSPSNESARSHSSRGPTPSKVLRDEKRMSLPRSPSKDHDRSKASRTLSSVSSGKTRTAGPSTPVKVLPTPATTATTHDHYAPQTVHSSSFVSQEGSQSIQSLVGTGTRTTFSYTQLPPSQGITTQTVSVTSTYTQPTSSYSGYQAPSFQQPPPPQQTNYQQPPASTYQQPSATTTYSQSYNYPPYSGSTQAPYTAPRTPYTQSSQYTQPPPPSYNHSYNYNATQQPAAPAQQSTAQYPSSSYNYNSQNYPNYPQSQSYSATPPRAPLPLMQGGQGSGTQTGSGPPSVRITGR